MQKPCKSHAKAMQNIYCISAKITVVSDFNKIGYALASTKEPRDFNQAINLKKQGIELIFFDDAASGSRSASERPEFGRMMAYLACNPGVSQIWVDKLSRIGRSMDETAAVIKKLNDSGIEVVSLFEPTRTVENDSPWGKVIDSMCSGIVENERKRLKERNALSHGKEIGRIPCDIPRDYVASMRNRGLRWSEIARRLHCNESTLLRRRHKWQEQDLLALMEKTLVGNE